VHIQRVVMPVTGIESWTVLGDDGAVVAPVERYLAYLSALERSPNTVRAYAASLRLWFEFLGQAGVGWADAGVEDVARFVAWLRAPAGNVIVLETGTGRRSAATVNRHLAGVFGFYDHHARSGVGVAGELVAWRRVSRGSYKPFLHHVTKGRPAAIPSKRGHLRLADSCNFSASSDYRTPVHFVSWRSPEPGARWSPDAPRPGWGQAAPARFCCPRGPPEAQRSRPGLACPCARQLDGSRLPRGHSRP
jgi:hypothetical protein